MDYEVPVSIQQAPVSDYEVPVSSNPSYSDHVPLSTNNNQLLATPVTTNPSYQPVKNKVELETEYYDTFDANKICTKSNTSYLPVDLKTTTTTVSPSVHIKRTNKRIRSYFNEELTNWEYILAALATLTVLITVTAIILSSLLMSGVANNSKSSFSPFTTKTSNHSTNNIGKDTSGFNCTCTNTNNNNINTSSLTVKLEREYYDTFDANKICTKSNTSYLPVDLKTTTTTVSPSVHIKRTNKRIRSYFNEELTNWEYILAALATLTVLITVTAIILLSLLMFGVANNSKSSFSPFIIKTSNHSTNNIGKDTSGPNCTCTNTNNNINTSSLTAIKESVLFIRKGINTLIQNRNMSTSDVLKQLNDYMYQVEIINESSLSLIPESNKPRMPTLTGLNLTSNIIVNRSEGCTVEITPVCTTFSAQCGNSGIPFIKDNKIMVAYSCNATPKLNTSSVVGVIRKLYDPDLQFQCTCYAISGMGSCDTIIHRCPYKEAVPALAATFTDIFSN
uniref:Uncharacterized protein n=1 Tax=Amphimedon queenslandica TaxID=400682 RepID=A0A1X7VRW5_AMPQE